MNSQQQQYGRSAVQPAMSAPYWSGPHGQHPSYPAYGAPRMMVPTYSQPSSAPVKTSNREDSVVGSGKGAGTKRIAPQVDAPPMGNSQSYGSYIPVEHAHMNQRQPWESNNGGWSTAPSPAPYGQPYSSSHSLPPTSRNHPYGYNNPSGQGSFQHYPNQHRNASYTYEDNMDARQIAAEALLELSALGRANSPKQVPFPSKPISRATTSKKKETSVRKDNSGERRPSTSKTATPSASNSTFPTPPMTPPTRNLSSVGDVSSKRKSPVIA